LLFEILLWGVGFYLYHTNKLVEKDIQAMKVAGTANHEAIQKYEKVIQQRLTKDLKHSTGQSILLHSKLQYEIEHF